MRFSTYLNNAKCMEWKINAQQGILFALLYEAPAWAKEEIIENRAYYFVSRNLILEELPMFFEKSDTVYRNLKVLQEKGLIEYIKQGKKDLIRITTKGKTWNEFKDNNSEKNPSSEQNSEKNPNNLGKKSEKEPKNSEKNPTNNNTIYNYNNTNILNNIYSQVINYLNEKANSKYKATSKDNQKHIKARINEGYDFNDFKKVIDNMCSAWKNTEFENYLRPSTLFGVKFENYLNWKKTGGNKNGNTGNKRNYTGNAEKKGLTSTTIISQTTQRDSMTGISAPTVSSSIFKEQDIQKYMGLSRLTEQDWYKRFENAEVKTPEEIEFKKSFEKYCKNFETIKQKGLGILMSGNPGTGKTYYTTCIMNALNQKYLVYKTTLSDLLEEIRKSYKSFENENDDFLFSRLSKAELIIFDDLGNEFLSDWGKEKMFMILNFIYENNKPLIINTNLDAKQLSSFFNINGSDKLLDRIRSKCKTYIFSWESRRKDLYKKDFEELY